MCVWAHVGGCACVFGGGGRMSVSVPSSEKHGNKYGIFGSDSKKASGAPAKSLCRCNGPELRCRKPVCVSVRQENVPCSCRGAAGVRYLGAGLGYDLEESESPSAFRSVLNLILALVEDEKTPKRFNYFPSKFSWTHNDY